MKHLLRFLAAVAASTASLAFALPETALMIPVRGELNAVLSLDAQRARQVDSILESAYARLSIVRTQLGAPADDVARAALLTALLTIRFETDTQLATVLTPQEFARMKESVYSPPWSRALPVRGTRM